MAEQLQLALLGNPEVRRDGVPIAGLSSGKALALLAYLAVTRRPHLRPTLVGLLWADMEEDRASNNLSKALTYLRQAVGPHLDITRQVVALNRERPYWLDVEAFEEGTAARSAPADSTPVGLDIEQLERAVELYRGDLLEGFYVRQAPAFEEWVLAQRARLRDLALNALHTLAVHHTRRGPAGHAAGMAYTARLLALEPWREEAHRQLMLLLASSGQRGAALAQFEACRRVLAEELGVEPAAETISLYNSIRDGRMEAPIREVRGQPAPAGPGVPPPPFLSSAPLRSDVHAPLIARRHELAQLHHWLEQALAGHGRVAVVTGEAGVGKTCLIAEFARRAQETHADLIVAGGNCNAYSGIGDPYRPFREIMGMLMGDVERQWTAGTLGREQALRLWNLIPHAAHSLAVDGPDLLGIFVPAAGLVARARAAAPGGAPWLGELEGLVATQEPSAGQAGLKQTDLFEQYARVLAALAQERPLLFILDDLQWADGGSLSLLFHLGRTLASATSPGGSSQQTGARPPSTPGRGPGGLPSGLGGRILIVGAYRPADVALGRDGERHPLQPVLSEFRRTFGDMEIDLDQSEGRSFVEGLVDSEPNRLGAGFRRALYRHTGGHPLFSIELLRAMQARGDLTQNEAGEWVEGPALDWESLPPRVEGTIAERIHRLPAPALETLRVASVEGEDFTAEVVARVPGASDLEIVRQLGSELGREHRLVMALGSERLEPSGARLSRYRFSHALFHRYIYHSLDDAERAYLHQAVGNALEQLYAGRTDEVASQLARHYLEAGLRSKAIDYLLQAGERAMRVYAYPEAIALLGEGLAMLKTEPDTPERARRELALQLAWGNAMMVTRGFVAPEVAEAYTRVAALCQGAEDENALRIPAEDKDIPHLFPALWGLCVYHATRAEHQASLELCPQLLRLAKRAGDQPLFLLQAHHAQWPSRFSMGEFAATHAHVEQCIALYDSHEDRSRIPRYGGHDAKLCGLLWDAPALWFLGYPEQALGRSRQALVLAAEFGDSVSRAHTHKWVAALYQLRREARAVQEHAEASVAIAAEHGLAVWEGWAGSLLGWALAQQGQAEAGIARMRRSMAMYQVTGGTVDVPHLLALLAEAYGAAGRIPDALGALANALAIAEHTGERAYEAEMYRLRGEMLLAQAPGTPAAVAEAYYWRAIEVARKQSARSLELRAAMSLARLWWGQGRTDEAREVLAPVYGWFTEGFDTADLVEARALLGALA